MKVLKNRNKNDENTCSNISRRMQMKPQAASVPDTNVSALLNSVLNNRSSASTAELDALLTYIGSNEMHTKKNSIKVTGWYSITMSNCAGISNESIMVGLKYVLITLKVEVFNFKRSVGDDGFYCWFLVDSILIANRLKRLKEVICVLYTRKPISMEVVDGLPSSIQSARITPDLLNAIKAALHARYNKDTRTLNLTRLHAAPELRDHFCALNVPVILAKVLELLRSELPEIMHLNVNCNLLSTLRAFEAYADAPSPSLQMLDVSSNRIDNVAELYFLNRLRLQTIKLAGNSIAKRQLCELRTWLPLVQSIECNVSSEPLTTICVADDDDIELEAPQAKGNNVQMLPKVVQRTHCTQAGGLFFASNFVNAYYKRFDAVNERRQLTPFYAEQCMFSLTVPSQLLHLDVYKITDRNHIRIQSQFARNAKLQVGAVAVVNALCNLPETRHHRNELQLDVLVFEPQLRILTLTGTFREWQGSANDWQQRHFQRTFVMHPMAMGDNETWIISNDILHIKLALALTPAQNTVSTVHDDDDELPPLQIEDADMYMRSYEANIEDNLEQLNSKMPKLAINAAETDEMPPPLSIAHSYPHESNLELERELEQEIDNTPLDNDDTLEVLVVDTDLF